MTQIINARLWNQEELFTITVGSSGRFTEIVRQIKKKAPPENALPLAQAIDLTKEKVVDAQSEILVPGMVDIHVHCRDPGLTHKEDWENFGRSAYKGGVIGVCDMPNTLPSTMDRKTLEHKMARACQTPLQSRFYLGVSGKNLGNLAPLMQDRTLPICGLKVYYGNSTGDLMFSDLDKLVKIGQNLDGQVLVFHSEDQGCIDHNSARLEPNQMETYSSFLVHSEIRSSRCALKSTRTIIDWATINKVPIHIAHLSTKAELEVIKEANAKGAQITSEVTPHHLIFSTKDYEAQGPFLKMNPPLRTSAEVQELREAYANGQIEIFATDHAPHTREEKLTQDYNQCPSGIPAVEYFTPLLLTLAKRYAKDKSHALGMGSWTPANMFGFPKVGKIAESYHANMVWVREESFSPSPDDVLAKCGWSPYVGKEMDFQVVSTWHQGKQVYKK